jgi:hypothetical protein
MLFGICLPVAGPVKSQKEVSHRSQQVIQATLTAHGVQGQSVQEADTKSGGESSIGS